MPSTIRIAHIGTASVLIEVGGLRILTDPVLDAPGERWSFGWGTRSIKLETPRLPDGELGKIDLVLLSHDHHGDNLDHAGRAMLPSAGRVLTTRSGAKRLGGNSTGLLPWSSETVKGAADFSLKVTATPARHGPAGSRPIVGEVVGFLLEWQGQEHGALWISGDTVYFAGIAEVAARAKIGTVIVHMGGVKFPISGPLRYTFNGKEAARAATEMNPRTIVPIHYEGWTHFREPRADAVQAFEAAKLSERVKWLVPGEWNEISV
jgi:L-ascorbate metabolism protein UlaG (beta-lactamase superfamily)